MKIAILGGGMSGLAAAYDLTKKGHLVTVFEKENILGGLAAGFKEKNWEWYLERTYHHLFSNDHDILNFASEIGFDDIFFQSPQTASLYELPHLPAGRQVFPVDTPQDFLRFPLLSLPIKIRAAFVLAFLKFSPFLSSYERQTAKDFLIRTMGEEAWNVLWQELFRKKFGKYAGNILASFIWARITKRTKNLGYVKGGFQEFINFVEKRLEEKGVLIKTGVQVNGVEKSNDSFKVIYENNKPILDSFDAVISTLPTPILTKITSSLFPNDYLQRLKKIKYLHAVNLILETDEPVLNKTYWLNVCTPKMPMMVVAQHTNFVDKKYYGGNNICYVANYIDSVDPLIKMSDKEVLDYYLPHLKSLTHNPQLTTHNYFVFKAPFAQPIFDREFVKAKPSFETPVKNFFIANLDMTYPYDRGTNYAVKVGREVSLFPMYLI